MDLSDLPRNRDLTYLGLASFRDQNKLFGIKRRDRRQHVYILGKSGTGKSALMFNMIIQNIQNGDGVCLVDPHGENVEGVLSAIPPHRLKDVIYFNPADTEYHIGFNVLELIDPKYKHLVASGLMGIFTKIWANAWSARMEYILNNAILALLDTPGTTLLGIPRMLVDKDYRQKIITNLKDPVIKAFWIHEYEEWQDKFRNEAIAPIQNKVGQFLSTSIIRNIVGQSKSTINIFDMMNEGKIFLVNVSKGRIGEDNSALLGGMIITKIQLAAMERVRIPEDERKDFYLYVDEFQNFVTDAFAGILSEARKYRLNLTVAHQYTAQLVTKESSSVRDAIFGNIGTMIVFRVGADDADFLEKEFEPEFTPEDIVNLPNYKVYMKLMIDGVTSRPFSAKTMPQLVKSGNQEIETEVIKMSRELYCKTKEEVEKEINNWSGMSILDENGNPGNNNFEKFDVECSSCGNATKVPFKPEKGRPVYCKDCITKIKAGEMKPVKGESVSNYKPTKFYKPLMDLGIEFAQEESNEQSKEPSKDSRESNNNKSSGRPKIFSGIKNVFSKNKNKNEKERDTSALKDILNKTLNNKTEEIKAKEEIKEVVSEPVEPPASLDILKSKTENKPPKNDKSASLEEMNKLKDFIGKFEEISDIDETKEITEKIVTKEVNEIKKEEDVKEQTPVFSGIVREIEMPEISKVPERERPLEDSEVKQENKKDEIIDNQNTEEDEKQVNDDQKKQEDENEEYDSKKKQEDLKNKTKEVPEDVLRKILG
ncbi:MAG: type IV secretion system DNA-binding domain-containing protein [Candidatus Pacebacteria bacterium]|nr:type IV secretion system DNA-binding domain-containing protein [Candidatus Paceibacterota bacterium]MCF7862899.1 type IV secretion system DNA-binding domain-containing protein [Candidatus Paceibacterota bacterium]